jgi:hypothetical protein
MKPKTEAPLCPLHSKPMKQLPALPSLTIGRGVTQSVLKQRRDLNAFRRYRCVVEGCPQVAAVSIESADDLDS